MRSLRGGKHLCERVALLYNFEVENYLLMFIFNDLSFWKIRKKSSTSTREKNVCVFLSKRGRKKRMEQKLYLQYYYDTKWCHMVPRYHGRYVL